MSDYSNIIGPASYTQLMGQHVYIPASDTYIASEIAKKVTAGQREVVEVGCGPARITTAMEKIPGIHLTGIDVDDGFLAYAKSLLHTTALTKASALEYHHSKPVDVFYSQGVHHHFAKGYDTDAYLRNLHTQLAENGVYIVGDEFLPDYTDDAQRKVKAIIWYAHVISSASKGNHDQLAIEEAKTLLDDLSETSQPGKKSIEQITLILDSVDAINQAAAHETNLPKAELLACTLLEKITAMQQSPQSIQDPTISLSRGDFKISKRKFAEEVGKAGFKILATKDFGPVDRIGGMSVMTLGK